MLITTLKPGGYKFGKKTFYSEHHLGLDLATAFEVLSFPVDLYECKYQNGTQGGLTVTGKDKLGYVHRFMHNSKFLIKTPEIKAETDFVVSGNSGSLTTNPHLHWDIRKPGKTSLNFSNFIDPETWKKTILPNIKNMEKLQQWEKDFWDEGIKKGITNGERPKDKITRVENVGMILKFEEYLVKTYGLKKKV